MNKKPILCIDFDGVLHSYSSGWKGESVIPDDPVPGAMAFIMEAVEHFEVHIYSSRSASPDGLCAMKSWIARHMFRHAESLDLADSVWLQIVWPIGKPSALVTIDDRAICFTGEWPTMESLKAFKPWNKKPDEPKKIGIPFDDKERFEYFYEIAQDTVSNWLAKNGVERVSSTGNDPLAALCADIGDRLEAVYKEGLK